MMSSYNEPLGFAASAVIAVGTTVFNIGKGVYEYVQDQKAADRISAANEAVKQKQFEDSLRASAPKDAAVPTKSNSTAIAAVALGIGALLAFK